jgi:flagellar export protein FliJ
MKRFSFPLETLLNHKKIIEDKERNELLRLRSLLQKESSLLQELKDRHRETLEGLAQQRGAGADQAEIEWFCVYLNRLKHEQEQSRKKIAALEKDVERQKTAVVEASKQMKVIDTLKSKQHRQYVSVAEKEEQKAVDELVVIRYPQSRRDPQ